MIAALSAVRARAGRLVARLGITAGPEGYLIPLAALIGLVMSGVAMAFILPLRWIEEVDARADGQALWWLVAAAPVAGGLLCGVVHHVIPSSGPGLGVTRVMYAIHRRKARLPWIVGLRKWLASTLTIGSGGSAGAEGPIVTIGSVIGSVTGQVLRASTQTTTTLLGCGAAAGISAVFNAPIAGVFFVMEILLRDFSLRTFTPIVIASVVSAAFTQGVLGQNALFGAGATFAGLEAFTWREIPNYLLLGVICGAGSAGFVRGLYLVVGLFNRLRLHPILEPALGALLLAACGATYLWLGGTGSREVPGFYGNGYPVIHDLLEHGFYASAGEGAKPMLLLFLGVVALGLMKGVATCLTIGSGGAGGMFAPALLLGASIGGAFGCIVAGLGWFESASPAHYALVGMAAMIAGTAHAPLTGILMVYEITLRYEVILPLMLAAVISTIVGRLVYRESVYTARLADLGVRVGAMSDLTILRRLTVADVPLVAAVFVRATDSAQRLLELSERTSVSDFVVTDAADRYVGLVTGSDLREALLYRESIPLLDVSELLRTDLPTVTPEDTLDVVLDHFSTHEVNSLVALDERGDRVVLGLVTRSRLMARYQHALMEG
jgi:CIC family chloride channel protein